MPDDIRQVLLERGLEAADGARPAYQQNDYLGWIARAKRAATREQRLAQMLDELAAGDRYMRMSYRAVRVARSGTGDERRSGRRERA